LFEIFIWFLTCLNYLWTRWQYYHPYYEDQNVVPYHCTTLMLWGAHMNMQQITSSYWSYYLLKYAMKCEPQSTIKLDDVSAKSLGLVDATPLQLQLISTPITTKLISWSNTFMFINPNHIKKCWCKVCWFKTAKLAYKNGD